MIKASKNGVERNFTEKKWKSLPHGKYGWIQVTEVTATKNFIPNEIVQKKIIPGSAADVSNVPEEIKVRNPLGEPLEQKAEIIPEKILVKKVVKRVTENQKKETARGKILKANPKK